MPYTPAAIVAAKLKSRGISDAQFAAILGIGKASVSRWFSDAVKPTYQQEEMMKSVMSDIDGLFNALAPIRPDLSEPTNARTLLKLFREKKLWIAVREVGYSEAFDLTRDEMEKAKTKFDAGIAALTAKCLTPEVGNGISESTERT